MKLNWGYGITITIILFMGFIIYLVIQTFQLNADLVQDDFYEQEVLFDEKKQSIQNYAALEQKVLIIKQPDGIQIQFPKSMKTIEGEIKFYRPDDKELDKNFTIIIDEERIQMFDYSEFLEGRYNIIVAFRSDNKSYLHQSTINF